MTVSMTAAPGGVPLPSDDVAFYKIGGTMSRDDRSYVSRKADIELHEALTRCEFCYVLTSRQMGKSSLMVRIAARLREQQMSVVLLDLTAFGQNLTPEQWYDGMRDRIGRQLGLEEEVEASWESSTSGGPLQRLLRVLTEVALPQTGQGIVVFIDEIDFARSLPFSTDEFFSAIRECYNRRPENPLLQRLTFCLLGVASPADLIRDSRTTPFNIGRRIELTDFTPAEAEPLAEGLGRDPTQARRLLTRILHWTGGHPYLTQALCRATAEDKSVKDDAAIDRLCRNLFLTGQARNSDDNLLFVRERILRSDADIAALLVLYRNVLVSRRVRYDESNPLAGILRLSGIVHVMNRRLRVRNRIYASVFDRQWVQDNLPDQEQRRQRAAYIRGVVLASAIAAVVILVVGALAIYAENQRRHAQAAAILARSERFKTESAKRVADEALQDVKKEKETKQSAFRALGDAFRAPAKDRYNITVLEAVNKFRKKDLGNYPPEVRISLRSTIAGILMEMGQSDEAVAEYREALAERVGANMPDDLDAADIYEGLAQSLENSEGSEDPAEILHYWTLATDIRRIILGKDNPFTIGSGTEMARHKFYKISGPEGEKALIDAMRPILGRDKTEAQIRDGFDADLREIRFLWKRGEEEKAIACMERWAKPFLDNPAASEQVPEAIAEVAIYLMNHGERETAEAIARGAIVIARKHNGADSVVYARVLAGTGFLLIKEHARPEDLWMLKTAIEISKTRLGPFEISTVVFNSLLMQSYLRLGKPDEAEHLRKALLEEAARSGPDSDKNRALVLHAVAESVLNNPKSDAAAKSAAAADLRESVEITRHVFGEKMPIFFTRVLDLDVALRATGSDAEAESLCNDLRAIVARQYGAQDERVGVVLNRLGLDVLKRDPDRAETLFREAHELCLKGHADAADISLPLRHVAEVQESKGRKSQCEQTLRELVSTDELLFGDDNAETIFALKKLATLLADRGANDEAKKFYTRAWNASVKLYGEENADTMAIAKARGLLPPTRPSTQPASTQSVFNANQR